MKPVSSVAQRICPLWSAIGQSIVFLLIAVFPVMVPAEAGEVDPTFSSNRGAVSQLSPSFYSAGDVAGIGYLGQERILIAGAAINSFNRYKSQPVESIAILGYDGTYISGAPIGSGIRVTKVLSDGKILAGGNLSASLDPIQRLNADLSPEDGFQPSLEIFSPDGAAALRTVLDIHPLADGKLMITGAFTAEGGGASDDYTNVARLEANGATDMSFHQGSGPNHQVRRSILQEDGKLLLMGDFTTVHGRSTPAGLARLNADGSIDASFNGAQEFDGAIHAIALTPNGSIFVGGAFSAVNGTPRNGIAVLDPDGALNDSLNPGQGLSPSTTVLTLLSLGEAGVLYGTDTYISEPHYAEIGSISLSGSVYADRRQLTDSTSIMAESTVKVNQLIANPDGSVFAAGLFSHVDGVEYGSVVKLEGTELNGGVSPGISIRFSGISDGQLRVSFVTEVGKTYQPVVAVDIGSSNWTPVGAPVEGSGGAMGAAVPLFLDTQFVRILERRDVLN